MSQRYIEQADECQLFKAAYEQRLPVLLKGPTGCGKTQFVESMAKALGRPLYTVSCHEDLTAADLVGRYLLEGGETVWHDGPLTKAVREGGICYLDEVVEARADTTVVIHPLTDHRRTLFLDRLNEVISAPDQFMLVLSYNPGYQSVVKDLKPSTRQRMVAIDFTYPQASSERQIIALNSDLADGELSILLKIASAIRELDSIGLKEVASTRALITAAKLRTAGLSLRQAVVAAIVAPLTDDAEDRRSLLSLVDVYLSSK